MSSDSSTTPLESSVIFDNNLGVHYIQTGQYKEAFIPLQRALTKLKNFLQDDGQKCLHEVSSPSSETNRYLSLRACSVENTFINNHLDLFCYAKAFCTSSTSADGTLLTVPFAAQHIIVTLFNIGLAHHFAGLACLSPRVSFQKAWKLYSIAFHLLAQEDNHNNLLSVCPSSSWILLALLSNMCHLCSIVGRRCAVQACVHAMTETFHTTEAVAPKVVPPNELEWFGLTLIIYDEVQFMSLAPTA